MDPTGLIVFAGALFVAAASPGPAVASLVARVLVRGTTGAAAFMLGLAVGDVAWLSAAALGLAFIAKTFALAFVAVKYAGVAYLLYLAWRMWTAPVAASPDAAAPQAERPLRLFATGLSLTLGNPKTMVFYLALLPSIVDLAAVTATGFAELVAVTLLVVTVVDGGYVLLAARVRRLFASPRALKLVNRSSGAMMAGAAVAVATR
jgi:threonine/homoserine/homoserine lactone efflux protein